jgi:hypothetical protein
MITKRWLEESSTRLLSAGTTIITARGTVGKCALAGNPMAMNQSCYGIRGKEGPGATSPILPLGILYLNCRILRLSAMLCYRSRYQEKSVSILQAFLERS